jgi:hypothetical protein
MKKILYGIFALILCSNVTFGQVPLMSDEAHRIMMNDYAVNLNTILTTECPQGITIDQFKKKIVNGEITLSSPAQTSILTYAAPLITYGAQFATNNNLTVNSDAEKIFLSSFTPSTLIDNMGNLIESSTTSRLNSIDIWKCAIETCNTIECTPFGVVGGNNANITLLSKTVVTKLFQYTGVTGIELMVSGFSDCVIYNKLDNIAFEIAREQYFIDFINKINTLENNLISIDSSRINELSSIGWTTLTPIQKNEIAIGLGFVDTNAFISLGNEIDTAKLSLQNSFTSHNIENSYDQMKVIKMAIEYSFNDINYNNTMSYVGKITPNCYSHYKLDVLNCKYERSEAIMDCLTGMILDNYVVVIALATNIISNYNGCVNSAKNNLNNLNNCK